MTPFIPGVPTVSVPLTDPYIELEKLSEDLALRLLRVFHPDASDDAWEPVGTGGARITAGELRRLNAACRRARRLRT